MQNGESCAVDTSTIALVKVDPLSVGGTLSPLETEVCIGQNKGAFLTLGGSCGHSRHLGVFDRQYQLDRPGHRRILPMVRMASTTSRATPTTGSLSKAEFVPRPLSTEANVVLLPVDFPVANIDPADTLISYAEARRTSMPILP